MYASSVGEKCSLGVSDRVKERNSLFCIGRSEIDLQCGTYSAEDALLPVVVEAAQEG